MRLLILGASGGCGRWATRLAAHDGHRVTAFVRPATRFEPPHGVTVERGDPLDHTELARVAREHDAVISCIGPQRTHPLNPWSPLRQPTGAAARSATSIVAALSQAGVRRCVAISAAGVGDSRPTMNVPMRWMLRHSTIGQMYADLEAMEQVLRQSELDWLAIRPVTLIDARPSTRARIVPRYRATSVVGRGDVAAWLVRSACAPELPALRTPMIGWW
jgi:uncharacterized protein YbjT (DUF2867 family)